MRPGLRPLLVLVALSAALAHATLPPFDFTGTWTGTVASRFDSVGMNFTLTSTGPRTSSGSVTFGPFENDPGAGATCRVNGTYGKRVKLHQVPACARSEGNDYPPSAPGPDGRDTERTMPSLGARPR